MYLRRTRFMGANARGGKWMIRWRLRKWIAVTHNSLPNDVRKKNICFYLVLVDFPNNPSIPTMIYIEMARARLSHTI